MVCIGFQNYLFSSSAASLSCKLRSLSLRAILRQDSKLVSDYHITLPSCHDFSVEYFDQEEHSVRTVVITEMYTRERIVYLVWCYRIQVERWPTKDLWPGRRYSWSVRALYDFLYACSYIYLLLCSVLFKPSPPLR
jgi:hypothetical protein